MSTNETPTLTERLVSSIRYSQYAIECRATHVKWGTSSSWHPARDGFRTMDAARAVIAGIMRDSSLFHDGYKISYRIVKVTTITETAEVIEEPTP
jgi:hypothetical protein